jgi:hypothetical protein
MNHTNLRARLISAATVLAVVAGAAAALPTSGAAAALPAAPPASAALLDILLIGNSESGSVSFLDGRTFRNLGSVGVIPDLRRRLAEMTLVERAGYELVREQKGGDRFVDDVAVSPDGRILYVSRGILADVVAVDLLTHQQLWRFKVEGFLADHMAISPDGARLVVSATFGQKAHVLNAATGTAVGQFPTGTFPHGNDYSPDGRRIYNASIGVVTLPYILNLLKGQKQVTVVDAATLRVVRTYTFAYGIRPAVFTPDERTMYAQLSYLNGFVEYDLVAGRITRTVNLPFSELAVDLLLSALVELDGYANELQNRLIHAYRDMELSLVRTAQAERLQALRDLLHNRTPARVAEAGLDPARRYRCLIADVTEPRQARQMEAALGADTGLSGLVDGYLCAVSRRLPALAHLHDVLVVTSPPVSPDALAEVYPLCRAGLESARRLARTGLHDLTALAVPIATDTHPYLGRMLAAERLSGLDAADEFHRSLADTALVYLEHGSRADLAAAALHVHPNTVKHRLRRLTELTGFDAPPLAGVPAVEAETLVNAVCWWWALRAWLR